MSLNSVLRLVTNATLLKHEFGRLEACIVSNLNLLPLGFRRPLFWKACVGECLAPSIFLVTNGASRL